MYITTQTELELPMWTIPLTYCVFTVVNTVSRLLHFTFTNTLWYGDNSYPHSTADKDLWFLVLNSEIQKPWELCFFVSDSFGKNGPDIYLAAKPSFIPFHVNVRVCGGNSGVLEHGASRQTLPGLLHSMHCRFHIIVLNPNEFWIPDTPGPKHFRERIVHLCTCSQKTIYLSTCDGGQDRGVYLCRPYSLTYCPASVPASPWKPLFI